MSDATNRALPWGHVRRGTWARSVTWVARGGAEPLVAAVLGACLAAVLAFDLLGPGASLAGRPTAIALPIAVVAGWTLSLRWAALVWAAAVGICAFSGAAGQLSPLNGAAIMAGTLAAGIVSHAGSSALQQTLAVLDRQVGLLRRASALVSGPSTLPAVVEEVLHAAVEVLDGLPAGGQVGAALLALEDDGTRPLSAVGADLLPEAGLQEPAGPGARAALARALEDARTAAADARGRTAMARVDAAGRPWGVLVAVRPAGPRFGRRELDLLRAIADLAGAAVDSRLRAADLERERSRVEETARRLRLAVEAAKDVGFETELDQVSSRLLARAAEVVGADRGSIAGIEGDRLVVQADWPDTGQPRPPGRALSLSGVPDLLERMRAGQPLLHPVPEDGGAMRHGLQLPLLAGGELIGVMALSRVAGGPFDDAELDALQQLTSLTALTLRSARLLAWARGLGQAKSEFLNMVAHELRTPLAVVRGYLSMMADGTLEVPEKTRSQVVTILCQKTDELGSMVEKILTAAQMQAGRVQLRRHRFDLREAIRAALQRARPRTEQTGVEVWCQPLPEPVGVEAVRGSVERILDNLIGNAIAYGNGLPVRLTVQVAGDVQVRVEDQGLGISPDQQARLFEPFFRVDQPSLQGEAGTGLGLAVSRRLAELSGGSLNLEWTEPGSGSTFVLTLPAAAQPRGRMGDGKPAG